MSVLKTNKEITELFINEDNRKNFYDTEILNLNIQKKIFNINKKAVLNPNLALYSKYWCFFKSDEKTKFEKELVYTGQNQIRIIEKTKEIIVYKNKNYWLVYKHKKKTYFIPIRLTPYEKQGQIEYYISPLLYRPDKNLNDLKEKLEMTLNNLTSEKPNTGYSEPYYNYISICLWQLYDNLKNNYNKQQLSDAIKFMFSKLSERSLYGHVNFLDFIILDKDLSLDTGNIFNKKQIYNKLKDDQKLTQLIGYVIDFLDKKSHTDILEISNLNELIERCTKVDNKKFRNLITAATNDLEKIKKGLIMFDDRLLNVIFYIIMCFEDDEEKNKWLTTKGREKLYQNVGDINIHIPVQYLINLVRIISTPGKDDINDSDTDSMFQKNYVLIDRIYKNLNIDKKNKEPIKYFMDKYDNLIKQVIYNAKLYYYNKEINYMMRSYIHLKTLKNLIYSSDSVDEKSAANRLKAVKDILNGRKTLDLYKMKDPLFNNENIISYCAQYSFEEKNGKRNISIMNEFISKIDTNISTNFEKLYIINNKDKDNQTAYDYAIITKADDIAKLLKTKIEYYKKNIKQDFCNKINDIINNFKNEQKDENNDKNITKFITELLTNQNVTIKIDKDITTVEIDYDGSAVVKGFINDSNNNINWNELKKPISEAIKKTFHITSVTFVGSDPSMEQYIRSYNIYNRVELKF